MKTFATVLAFAAAATAISAPSAFAMTELDSQLERSVYGDLKDFGLDAKFSEGQVAALTTNELVLVSSILADQDANEIADRIAPSVEQRIKDIIVR